MVVLNLEYEDSLARHRQGEFAIEGSREQEGEKLE
jgi:hypothetical protein